MAFLDNTGAEQLVREIKELADETYLPIIEESVDAVSADLATHPRPNLLENWYFVGGGSQLGYDVFPINQRGQTTYTTVGDCIDRWKINTSSASITINSSYVTMSKTGSASGHIIQTNLNPQIAGKVCTASILTDLGLFSGTGTFPARGGSNADVIVESNFVVYMSWRQDFQEPYLGIALTNGDVNVIAIKLELGNTQTLAHQENGVWVLNEVPSYGEEYAESVVSRAYSNGFEDITSAFTPTSGIQLQALKIGNMVVVRATGQRTGATTAWVLANIPTQYRPSGGNWVGAAYLNEHKTGVCSVAAGQLIIPVLTFNTNWCSVEITWILGAPSMSS